MPHVLDGCRLKVERAIEHNHAFNAEVRVFLSTHPYRIVVEFEQQTREGVVRLQGTGTPPLMWSIYIGEIVHDLRSALDHLVWQLARLQMGDPPRPLPPKSPWGKLQFPIALSQARFNELRVDWLKGLDPQDVADIEALQPYMRSKGAETGDLLWRLSELSNIDKHRTPHIVGPFIMRAVDPPVLIDTDNCRIVSYDPVVTSGSLEDGAELARFTAVRDGPHPKVYVKNNAVLDVALDEPGPLTGWETDVVGALQVLAIEVKGIIESFAHRFV